MKIISNSALRAFAAEHPQADAPLKGWRRVIEKNRFANWSELKASFNSVDRVGDLDMTREYGSYERSYRHAKTSSSLGAVSCCHRHFSDPR
jgi:hypothetical protein